MSFVVSEENFQNFEVRVSLRNTTTFPTSEGQQCAFQNTTIPATGALLTCSRPITGRYVTVYKPANHYLTMCEVKVYGERSHFTGISVFYFCFSLSLFLYRRWNVMKHSFLLHCLWPLSFTASPGWSSLFQVYTHWLTETRAPLCPRWLHYRPRLFSPAPPGVLKQVSVSPSTSWRLSVEHHSTQSRVSCWVTGHL